MTDWKAGDLAVCVDASETRGEPYISAVRQLTVGSVYRVVGIADSGGLLLEGLRAAYEHDGKGWNGNRFRKVQHDKPEACETAFTVLLNRSKRKVGA